LPTGEKESPPFFGASDSADHLFRSALARAARYRFVATLLEPPRQGRQEALCALARELLPDTGIEIHAVLRPDDEWVKAEYQNLFAPRGPISPFASDHVEGGLSDKGFFLGDVAGFYRAFGFEAALRELADHFATIFSFLAFLAAKQAYGAFSKETDQIEIAAEAEQKFLHAFVRSNLPIFLEKLESAAPEGGVLGAYPETIFSVLSFVSGIARKSPPRGLPPAAPSARSCGMKRLYVLGTQAPARPLRGPDATAYWDLDCDTKRGAP
jgi:TorA maturation chaperone TorD